MYLEIYKKKIYKNYAKKPQTNAVPWSLLQSVFFSPLFRLFYSY